MAGDLDERARRQLPGALEHANILLRFAEDNLSRTLYHEPKDDYRRKWSYVPTDDLGYMAWVFACRQMDHLKSVVILIENGQHMDAGLVARSMLEGLALVLWPDGPMLWRRYAFVSDWKKLRKILKHTPEDRKRMKWIEQVLADSGAIFHSDKALKAQAKGRSVDDPYREPQHWTGRGMPFIAEKAGVVTEYKEFYRRFSAWLHWNVTSFSELLDVQLKEHRISYRSRNERKAIVALLAAYQSASGTLIHCFNGRDEELAAQVDELRRALTEFLGSG